MTDTEGNAILDGLKDAQEWVAKHATCQHDWQSVDKGILRRLERCTICGAYRSNTERPAP